MRVEIVLISNRRPYSLLPVRGSTEAREAEGGRVGGVEWEGVITAQKRGTLKTREGLKMSLSKIN